MSGLGRTGISRRGSCRLSAALALTLGSGAVAGCVPLPGLGAGGQQTVTETATVTAAQTPGGDGQTPADEAHAVGGGAAAVPAGFEHWYGQPLSWTDCGEGFDGFECALITAPLSWQDPNAGEIELALMQHRATGTPIGSLLINPGGPGGSGVEFVSAAWAGFGSKLRDAYNVIGFDPRGVGQSTQVVCMNDADKDAFLSEDFPDSDAGREQMAEANRRWGEACKENTGDFLGHVDTQSAARDMDLIRALVGDDRLNYLGFSYGTQLGATYAGLFPQTVGRMVLDGAIDVTLSADESSLQQAEGFENALRAYVTDCQAQPRCPLTGSVADGMNQIKQLLDGALTNPLPTAIPGRVLTQTLAFYGVAVTLYDQASWGILTQALQEAIDNGTGNMLLMLADFYNDRNPDGSFGSNSTEAFMAVGCLDERGTTDPAEMAAEAARILEVAPTMGAFFGYGGLTCRDWPVPEVASNYDRSAPSAPEIMVIGTTGDPATPYKWAQALSNTLASGFLVTYEGEGHTAYSRSNDCIIDAVDNFLVDGVNPVAGLTC